MDKQKVLQWIDEVLKTDGWITDKKDHYDTIWLTKFRDEMASGRFDLQVSQDFCGRLTGLERKELEVIWNKLTDYGKQPMTYQKYLDAGLEIMTMSYLTGKRDSKNSG